jgi:hypothetical protein
MSIDISSALFPAAFSILVSWECTLNSKHAMLAIYICDNKCVLPEVLLMHSVILQALLSALFFPRDLWS